jgi:hypothetical protein
VCSVVFETTTAGHTLRTWARGALRYFQHKLFHCTAHLMDEGGYRPPYFTRFHSHSACHPASQLSPLAPHSHCVENPVTSPALQAYETVCVSITVSDRWEASKLCSGDPTALHNSSLWADISDYVVHTVRGFRLPPWSRWEVRSSGLLCSV